jgi:hypothetical protein
MVSSVRCEFRPYHSEPEHAGQMPGKEFAVHSRQNRKERHRRYAKPRSDLR